MVLVVGLFLVFDRLMYYKLGQSTQKTHCLLSGHMQGSKNFMVKEKKAYKRITLLYKTFSRFKNGEKVVA